MAGMVAEPSISSVVILDNNGERIAARYFGDGLQTFGQQTAFEKSLLNKALKSTSVGESDIVMFDGHIAVFRGGKDVFLFVTGDQDENEIILVEVLNALYNTCTALLPGGSVDRQGMLDRLDTVLLCLDELVDGGVILEIESSAIVNRVGMKGADGAGPGAAGATPLQSQTPQQALLSLKEQMTRAFKSTGTTFSG
mmetsp:Transcript_12568/g.19777  ORF Transcript_12568/g.19777 Transcript_12568/m.19777 type:complete len:196 (-) Transcript_12568:698-1285(-)